MRTEDFLLDAYTLLQKKNHDYADKDHPFQAFEYVSEFVSFLGTHDRIHPDTVFQVFIGTKLCRITNLISQGCDPENESLRDSFIDLINYIALWGAYTCATGTSNETSNDT